MKPVAFAEQNAVIGEGQQQYIPVPAHHSGGPEGVITSCWQLSDEELAELRTNGGRMWLQQITFNDAMQPILPAVFKPEGLCGPT